MGIPLHHPPTCHLKHSDVRVDTLYVLRWAWRTTGWADMNACPLLDEDVCGHWPNNPVWNHYTWIWTGRRTKTGREIRRPLTHAERIRPLLNWTWAEYKLLRSAEKGGHKPRTVQQVQRRAALLRVKIAWDVKGSVYARYPRIARRLVAKVKAGRGVGVFFVLADTGHWRAKVANLHAAGGLVAINAHGAKKPDDLAEVRKHADAVWGRWS